MPLECKSHACQVLPTAILTVKHTLQATHSLVPRSTCQYKITDDNKIPYDIKHVVTKMYRHPFYLLPVYPEALPLLIGSTDKTPLILRVGELVTHCHRKRDPWRMMTPQKLDKLWVSEELLLNQIHTVRLLFLVVQQWCIPAHAPGYSFSKQTLFIALTFRNIPKYRTLPLKRPCQISAHSHSCQKVLCRVNCTRTSAHCQLLVQRLDWSW